MQIFPFLIRARTLRAVCFKIAFEASGNFVIWKDDFVNEFIPLTK
jgi:hypothetical protein